MAGPPAATDATIWLQGDEYLYSATPGLVEWPDSSGTDNGFGTFHFTASGGGIGSNPWPTTASDLNGHQYLVFNDTDAALGDPTSTFTQLAGGFGALTFGAYPDLDDLYNHDAATTFVVVRANQIRTHDIGSADCPQEQEQVIWSSTTYAMDLGLKDDGSGGATRFVFMSVGDLNEPSDCGAYAMEIGCDLTEWDIVVYWLDQGVLKARTARRPTVVEVTVGDIFNGGPGDDWLVSNAPLVIGAAYFPMNFDSAEVVTYDRVLSCVEFNGVLTYLSEKYDIPCPIDPCEETAMGRQRVYTTAIGIH